MVQDLQARVPGQAGVWDAVKAKARVEAEWVDLTPQARAEIAYAQNAEQQPLMLPDSPVLQ